MTREGEWLLIQIRALRASLGGVAATGGLRTPAHATTHQDGGSDEIDIATLGGFSGDASEYLDGSGAFSTPAGAAVRYMTIGCVIGDGTNVITAGAKGIVSVHASGTIIESRIFSIDPAVTSGSIVVDIWRKAPATHYPPVVGDTITASAKPTLSTQTYVSDTGLSSWDLTVVAGDMFRWNVEATPSGVKQIVSLLRVQLT